MAEFNHERKPGTAAHLGSSGRVSVTTRDVKFGEGLFFFFFENKSRRRVTAADRHVYAIRGRDQAKSVAVVTIR